MGPGERQRGPAAARRAEESALAWHPPWATRPGSSVGRVTRGGHTRASTGSHAHHLEPSLGLEHAWHDSPSTYPLAGSWHRPRCHRRADAAVLCEHCCSLPIRGSPEQKQVSCSAKSGFQTTEHFNMCGWKGNVWRSQERSGRRRDGSWASSGQN